MEYLVSTLTFTGITLIGVLCVYMITGLTGLFSFGQAAFLAIGAYVSAVLYKMGVPLPLAALAAMIVGLLAALAVGLPTVKLRRDYISLVTLGFGEAIIAILNNTTNITGGATGLSGVPQRTTFPVVVAGVIVCLAIVSSYKNSKYGRQCLALRNDELAAKSMGINVEKLKLLTFMIGSVMTTFAGVLYVFYTSYVEPGAFGWQVSAEWVIIVFVGGVNSMTGAAVAALLLTGLPEALRFASEWRIAAYCVIVLLIINFRPRGIFGEYEISFSKMLRALRKGAGAA